MGFIRSFMKLLVWIEVLLAFGTGQAYAQSWESAFVSGIQMEVKLNPAWRSILNEESFPDYLESDTIWQSTLREKIHHLVGQKFKVKQTIFAEAPLVHFFFSRGGAFTASSPEKKAGQLSVSIHHTIGLVTTAMDETGIMIKNFNYTCRIRAKDPENKIVYEGNTSIPFRTRVKPKAGMYGMAELSADDLKQLFEQALSSAFISVSKKLPHRTYYRPSFSHPKYDSFIAKAELFSLQEIMPDIPAQKGQPQSSRYLFTSFHKTAQPLKLQLRRNYSGNVRSAEDRYTCRAILTHEASQTEYEMWATLQQKMKTDAGGPVEEKPEVSVRCFSNKLLLGDFTLTAQRFEGVSGYSFFTIHQINPRYTLELRLNNEVKALIQKSSISSVSNENIFQYYVYLPEEASQEDRAELLTIFIIYKVAYDLGQDFL